MPALVAGIHVLIGMWDEADAVLRTVMFGHDKET
jgi:hypothetical protein